MGSAAGGDGESRERIEGVRIPCWDAKRRVWKAIELLEAEQRTASSRSKPAPSPEQREASSCR